MAFFGAVVILAWFLYPRELFLGFIFEGTADLARSERYYMQYLEERPFNKFATLHLANLYDRMGEPERSTPLLEGLYEHRKTDWAVASRYLDHLENMHDEAGLYRLQRRVARNFLAAPMFPKGRIMELLEGALSYALWTQDMEGAYDIIADVLQVTGRPADFMSLRADLDRGLQDTERVLAFLYQQLKDDPAREYIRKEISNVHVVMGERDKAIEILTEGIKRDPKSKLLYEARLVLHVKLADFERAIQDAQRILAMDSLYYNERADYIEKLSVFYHKLHREDDQVDLYSEAIRSEVLIPADRLYFANRLDILYRDRKHTQNLVALYEEILRLESIPINDKYDYFDKLGFFYTQTKTPEKIIPLYRGALEVDEIKPAYRIDLFERLAYTYTQLKQPERVAAIYVEAIASDHLNAAEKVDFIEQLAAFHARAKVHDKVKAVYREAIDNDALDTTFRLGFVEQLAALLAKERAMDQVAALYDEVLAWEDLDQEDRINVTDQLAFLFTQMKAADKVALVYRNALESERFDLATRIDYVEQLAALHAKAKKTDAVVALYRDVLEWDALGPTERTTMYDQLIYLYSQRKDLTKVEATYREAMASEDLEPQGRLNFVEQLAGWYILRKQQAKAIALYEEIRQWDDLPSEQHTEVIENLAYLYGKMGDTKRLEGVYRSAINSEHIDLTGQIDFVERLAATYAKAKRSDAVIALYREALERGDLESPMRGQLLEALSTAYIKAKRLPEAMALFLEATASETLAATERIYFVEQLAGLYTKAKANAKILPLYEAAMAIPDITVEQRSHMLEQRAFLSAKLGKTQSVIALYREALAWDNLPMEDRLYFVERLAATYAKAKQDAQVTALYREVLGWTDLTSEQRLDIVGLLAANLTSAKNEAGMIALYKDEIAAGRLETAERIEVIRLLADVFFRQKDYKTTESYHRLALETDSEDDESWQNLIYFYEFLNRTNDEIDLIKFYLSRFPDDTGRLQLLVDLYLYKKKDLSQLPLYYRFIRKDPKEGLGLGVLDLLLKAGQIDTARQWVRDIAPLFPESEKMVMTIVSHHMEAKDPEAALTFLLSVLERMPRQPNLVAMAALLHANLGNLEMSEDYFIRFDQLEVQEAKTLLWVGKESYFAGKHARALTYLDGARTHAPKNADAWFWYAELLYAAERMREGLAALEVAQQLLDALDRRTIEQERMLLKIRGRIRFDATLEAQYATIIAKYPREPSFLEDLLDLYLDQQNPAKASEWLGRYAERFPKERKSLQQFQTRLASARKDWEGAIQINTAMLDKDPNDITASLALATAYHQAGRWSKAIATYENIAALTESEKSTLAPLVALYAMHDNRLSTKFQMGFFGTDQFTEGEARYESFLSDNVKFQGVTTVGSYKAAAADFHDIAETGRFTLERPVVSGFAWKAGIGVGHSPRHLTPSGHAAVSYTQPGRFGTTVSLDYREMRKDFPQAVAGGALRDMARLDGDAYVGDRLYFFGRLELKRNYIPNGAKAHEFFFEPGVAYDLLTFPKLNVGYHLTISQLFAADEAFLDDVPLLKKLQSHVFAVQLSHDYKRRLFYGISAFAGEDPVKKTHFFKGDLFGVGANARWVIRPWLEMQSSYGFGQETLASIAGSSHQFAVALSGHWH